MSPTLAVGRRDLIIHLEGSTLEKVSWLKARVLTQPLGRAFAASREFDAVSVPTNNYVSGVKSGFTRTGNCIFSIISYIGWQARL